MDQSVNLIALLATGFGLALFFGYLANYFKIPTLVGYLFAGFFIGPFAPGYVGDQQLANPQAAKQMGQAGRGWVIENWQLSSWSEKFNSLLISD